MFGSRLAQANDRLRLANIRVAIEQRGDRLCLRATLPPKPDSHKARPYQQRIALDCRATEEGLKYAIAEAKKISALLDQHQFNWHLYLPKTEPERIADLPTAEIVARFKARKFAEGITARTWETSYATVYKNLPEYLTPQNMEALVMSTKANSRTRSRYYGALKSLAEFAEIPVNLAGLGGSYSPQSVEPRDIPSDRLIQGCHEKIPTKQWRWAYGMLATYGLRPSELGVLEFADFPILRIRGTKNKASDRECWPIYPEWIERFGLEAIAMPKCKDFGMRTHHVFSWNDIPFPPMALRHAWAIRAELFGLPTKIAAAQQGHSLTVHEQTYQRWINREHFQQAYELVLNRSDRLLPPD